MELTVCEIRPPVPADVPAGAALGSVVLPEEGEDKGGQVQEAENEEASLPKRTAKLHTMTRRRDEY